MIYNLLLVLLILTAIVLVLAILMQAGKGGGLAANFGGAGSSSDSFLGSRQASNILTKSSWAAGGVFLCLAYILSLASTGRQLSQSILEQQLPRGPAPAQPAIPAPGGGAAGGMLNPDTGGKAADTGSASAAGKSGG